MYFLEDQESLWFFFAFCHKGVVFAYLRLLIFLWAILIPACASSSLAFHMMYSAYKLSKQGVNIQTCCTPFSIWNQSIVPCLFSLLLFDHYIGFSEGRLGGLVFPLFKNTRLRLLELQLSVSDRLSSKEENKHNCSHN